MHMSLGLTTERVGCLGALVVFRYSLPPRQYRPLQCSSSLQENARRKTHLDFANTAGVGRACYLPGRVACRYSCHVLMSASKWHHCLAVHFHCGGVLQASLKPHQGQDPAALALQEVARREGKLRLRHFRRVRWHGALEASRCHDYLRGSAQCPGPRICKRLTSFRFSDVHEVP